MITYATSDLHGQLPDAFPSDADLLLIAGDICPDFRPFKSNQRDMVDRTGARQAEWLREVFQPWLTRATAPIVAIWGNHDFVGETSSLVPPLPGVCMLQDCPTYRAGLKVWGTPWVPGLPYWAFYAREEALQARSEGIPAGIDVLMTHGPPYGAGDYIPGGTVKQVSKYGNRYGMNVGDAWMNRAIERTKPHAVVCGHIHEARGVHHVAGVPVYNVSAVDANYAPHPNPWTRLYALEAS